MGKVCIEKQSIKIIPSGIRRIFKRDDQRGKGWMGVIEG
jgi:hypothetical protein